MTAQWKETERRVAALLGGCRVPVSDRGRGDAPDVAHPYLAIECKHRKSVPRWLLDAMNQATAAARGGQVPAVIIHRHGAHHAGDLVVLRLADVAGGPPE